MDSIKRVTEINVDQANSVKGGKTCNCSCSCGCAQTNTTSATKTSERDATTLNKFI